MSEIAVTDIVRCKSGGPTKVVVATRLRDKDGVHEAECAWVDDLGTAHSIAYPEACLLLVRRPR